MGEPGFLQRTAIRLSKRLRGNQSPNGGNEARKAVAGAAKGALKGAFDTLPYCSDLVSYKKLSIKLCDEQLQDRVVMTFILRPGEQSEPLPYLIRDENQGKACVLIATYNRADGGFSVKKGPNHVMSAVIPNASQDCLGKIEHPTAATVYKVYKAENELGATCYEIRRPTSKTSTAETDTEKIKIDKVMVSLYPVAKMIGLLGTDCVYWFKDAYGVILGYVRPKIVAHGSTLILKFMNVKDNPQQRAAILGATLLLIMSEVYPTLSAMARETKNGT